MVRDEAYYRSVTEQIIGCAYRVANTLGPGFLEKVYENALAHELHKSGLQVDRQRPLKVFYDDVLVGDFCADLIVDGAVMVELKATKNLNESHVAQCLNYLKATGMRLCLLINFGTSRIQVKRVVSNL